MLKVISLIVLALELVAAAKPHPHASKKVVKAPRKAVTVPGFGLSSGNLKKGNVAIGFIPVVSFSCCVNAKAEMLANTMTDINSVLPKPMSLVGTYTAVDPVNNPNFQNIDPHVAELVANQQQFGGAMPVFQLAVMPNNGFASVTQAQANVIAKKMASINAQNITVWLRYAHEMNGDWYAYGQQPAAFLASWKMVTNAVRAVTNNTFMLWSPNSLYGTSVNAQVGGWTPYWPGSNYVDLVGMSFYSYGGHGRENVAATSSFFPNMMSQFDKLYGAGGAKKPIILSETSASYTTNLDGKVNSGGDSELKIKTTWWSTLLSSNTAKKYPYLRAITWFEIEKEENASGNTPVRNEDFRSLLGAANVRKAILKMFGNGQ